MVDPYRMVVVNIISSLLLFGGMLFYKFIYPKKKINLLFLLILISILPVISIFRTGTYESGDFNIHVRRAMEFYSLVSQGDLMPTWAADLNATYGYPLFAFNYTLPYYIISFFHFLGFSFITSLKLFLAFNFVLSGIFMYLFSKKILKNSLAAFCASIFYLFTPYHLISLHFKITIGEILAYTFIPLTFYFINNFLSDKKIINLLLSGFFLGVILLSHIFIGLFLIPVIALYVIFSTNNFLKGILYSFGIIAVSLLISMYQWTAPLIYRQYLFTTAHPIDPSKAFYFPSIMDLLYAPWKFGLLFQGPKGELSFLLGYTQLLALLITMVLLLKNKIKKEYKNKLILWVVLFFGTIFLITPYSIFIWRFIPLVNQAGSQRLLIIVALYTSLFVGYIALEFKKKKWIIYLLVILTISTTILNWGQRRVISTINDTVLMKDISLGTKWADTHFYALPKWVNPNNLWFSNIPKSNIEILKGNADIQSTYRAYTMHVYKLDAKDQITLRENTLYFPGWKASSNGKSVGINPDRNGIVTMNLYKGKQTLELSYSDLPLFMLSKIISVISIFLVLMYIIFYSLKSKLINFPKL